MVDAKEVAVAGTLIDVALVTRHRLHPEDGLLLTEASFADLLPDATWTPMYLVGAMEIVIETLAVAHVALDLGHAPSARDDADHERTKEETSAEDVTLQEAGLVQSQHGDGDDMAIEMLDWTDVAGKGGMKIGGFP